MFLHEDANPISSFRPNAPVAAQPFHKIRIVCGFQSEVRLAHFSLGEEVFDVGEKVGMVHTQTASLSKANSQPGSYRSSAWRALTLYAGAMIDDAWRARLTDAIKGSGKSWNKISKDAGLAPNYLNGILKLGKEPGLDRLLRICDSIPASPAWIIHGYDVTPEDEQILQLLRRNPKARQGIFALIATADSE